MFLHLAKPFRNKFCQIQSNTSIWQHSPALFKSPAVVLECITLLASLSSSDTVMGWYNSVVINGLHISHVRLAHCCLATSSGPCINSLRVFVLTFSH